MILTDDAELALAVKVIRLVSGHLLALVGKYSSIGGSLALSGAAILMMWTEEKNDGRCKARFVIIERSGLAWNITAEIEGKAP